MIVTFVSECEKKALPRTRRVLDAFANRIGSRTWQVVITNEGLTAVKKLLRKTASKNTAVACHWVRGHRHTELVWIVGNRRRFNMEGFVPVNYTRKAFWQAGNEEEWQYLPLVKALTALAALLHDWGKASEFFQYKLGQKGAKGDPLRHEWVSLLFFSQFVNKQTDQQWLDLLVEGDFQWDRVRDSLSQVAQKYQKQAKYQPLKLLSSPAAQLIGWLIVTHHKMPFHSHDSGKAIHPQKLLGRIHHEWGYQSQSGDEFLANVSRCFNYDKGLPSDSKTWCKQVVKQAKKLQAQLPQLEKTMEDGSWRAIALHCRLSLMLGDHYYSSLKPDSPHREDKKHRELTQLVANTDQCHQPKQTLDEHLVGVSRQAERNAHFLKYFSGQSFDGEEVLAQARDLRFLKPNKNAPEKYQWQDRAVSKIKAWRAQHHQVLDAQHFAFFCVNMASTGTGKTFANAKIMQALSPEGDSLRFVLALGLRTLTLQTGDEYRERVGLGDDELAVLIGSKAVLALHQQANSTENGTEEESPYGSDSEAPMLDNELSFTGGLQEHLERQLETVLRTSKERQFLYAPVLACTLDHMMAATETKRGGRYILPTLRLMYSDLVIDEIDDFDGEDLVAIGRLIHLAGMLGRKVMISSATIPPDMAEGYFNTYQEGWKIYARLHNQPLTVGCAWVDDSKRSADLALLNCSDSATVMTEYKQQHRAFVQYRLGELLKAVVKRKGEVFPVPVLPDSDGDSLKQQYFAAIQRAIVQQHQRHGLADPKTQKQVSFGIVRLANIPPCIELTRYLLNADWGDDIDIRAMAYHSQQVLLMRHEQEKHLDEVLKRKQGRVATYDHPLIRQHLNEVSTPHVIFILVATPVEEVGRDHSADWAVVEPSSYRSFIQLAGRVLRHEDLEKSIDQPNITLMQYNLKGLKGKSPAFHRPGYETSDLSLDHKNLDSLVDCEQLQQSLDATPRVSRPEVLQPQKLLADLEHESIHRRLTDYALTYGSEKSAGHMQNWLLSYWWLTAMPQQAVRFRRSPQDRLLYLSLLDERWCFVEKQGWSRESIPIQKELGIEHNEELTDEEKQRLWLYRDYAGLLQEQVIATLSLEAAALIYGELRLVEYETSNQRYTYSSQFGLLRK